MEHSVLFEEQVSLNSNDLSKKISLINDILMEKVKNKLENKCSRYGFVLPGTLKMLSRSMGKASSGRFVADYLFQIQIQGDVLNPPDGEVLEGEVIRKNKMGIYLNYKNAIRIIIPRDLHIGNDDFDAVQIGDTVRVQIKKSRFQINDENILSVGLYLNNVKGDVEQEEDEEEEEEEDDKEKEKEKEKEKAIAFKLDEDESAQEDDDALTVPADLDEQGEDKLN